MYIHDTNPDTYCYGTRTKLLSDQDKERVKVILEELKSIYECDSVSMHPENIRFSGGCDYVIRLNNSTNGMSWNKG